MILLIDNYDSFVFNLARYFQRLGQTTHVVRNDALSVSDVRGMRPSAIVLSPGPCTPDQAGISLEVVRQLHGEFPILGVCLGHQVIGQALGGAVVRAAEPIHGRASLVEHRGEGVFAGLPNPLSVGRYHSLVLDESTLPSTLEVTAHTADGVVMAVEHRQSPCVGVQFHPESILTECGYGLLANFLRRAGLTSPPSDAIGAGELAAPPLPFVPPPTPVTF